MLQRPELHAVKISKDIPRSMFALLYVGLTQERQDKINRFRNYADAQSSLVAELLLRQLIKQHTGRQGKEVVFGANDYGKPFLADEPSFHFNLAHSGKWIVCAIDSVPVGVDVEQIQPLGLDIEDISKRLFSADECRDVMNKPEPDRTNYFFNLWTLKESYIKAVGEGLSIALDSFSVRIHRDGVVNFQTEVRSEDWFFRTYDIDCEYKVALCATKDCIQASRHIWDEEVLLENYSSYSQLSELVDNDNQIINITFATTISQLNEREGIS